MVSRKNNWLPWNNRNIDCGQGPYTPRILYNQICSIMTTVNCSKLPYIIIKNTGSSPEFDFFCWFSWNWYHNYCLLLSNAKLTICYLLFDIARKFHYISTLKKTLIIFFFNHSQNSQFSIIKQWFHLEKK